ncbi:MAG: HEAT repeat domain-containing protein, partial [Planctomycetales bacterium]|nr:HEAT repeat domain-containing protein [Planctomycetales bacterium]
IRLAILDVLTDMGPQAAEAVPALALAMRQDMNRSRTEERHQDFRAAIALSHIGKPAVEVLRNLLTEESEGLRAEATAALGRIGPDASAALADLVRMLGDDSPRVRDDAAIAVGNMGIAAFAPLLTAIGKNASKASNSEANVNETSARAKAAAVRALGELLKQTAPEEPSEVQSVLESAVGDPDAEVRAQAVQAIVQSGLEDARVDELLIHSLQDTVESVSVAATNALATRAAMIRRTSTELAKLLRDSHDHAARQAAFLLHFLGDDGATLLLNASQHSDSRIEHIAHSLALIGQPIASRLTAHLDSSDPRLRQVAVLALGEMRPLPQDVVAKLAERLPSEDPQVQISILHALASLGNRATNAVDAVRELKNDPRDAVRLQVIDVLFSAAPKDAKLVSELTSMIGDTQPQVQERAIERITALGPIGVRAVDDVLPQLDSENDGVRRAAAAMLASFGRSAQAAVPQLIKHLHGDDLSWRLFVIAILGQFGETAQPARAELSQLIQDPAPDVRAAALQALANLQLDPSEIRGELYSALNDSEQAVVDV